MKELFELYETMGISPAVYAYGEQALEKLKERFAKIDQIAEYNQAKVLSAMQRNRVSAACFAATTGYGYDDVGLRGRIPHGSRAGAPPDYLRHPRADSCPCGESLAWRRAAQSRGPPL